MCDKNKKIIIWVLIVLLVWILFKLFFLSSDSNNSNNYQNYNYENYDPNLTEFVPLTSQRFGLRGEPLHPRPISDYYYGTNRNIRLDGTGNWMYQSNVPINLEPGSDNKSCVKGLCPNVNGYDKLDSCYTCNIPSDINTTPKACNK